MKTAITGATGFLGTALSKALDLGGEHELVRLSSRNCDLTDAGALGRHPHPAYDRIYHLAAWTRAGDFCLRHPGEQWIVNQQINTNVLSWWLEDQPQAKLICIGTSCSYDEDLPLSEENYLAGEPTPSLYTYAMTKRLMYVGLRALRAQFGLSYLHVVPSTLYGPGYHEDERQMHFIFDLIQKILMAKYHGEKVVLWGDGHQRRELVYVDDFVALLLDLERSQENECINIGAGEDYSIRDFARMICEVVGYDSERIEYDESRYVGARSKCLRVDKLRRLVPALRLTPLRQGLEATIEWMTPRIKARREALLRAPGP